MKLASLFYWRGSRLHAWLGRLAKLVAGWVYAWVRVTLASMLQVCKNQLIVQSICLIDEVEYGVDE